MANLVKEDPASKPPADDTSRANSHDASDIEKAQPDGAIQPDTKSASPNDEDLYQPGQLRFWLIMLCNFLALFLVGLDRMIIATAVPQITNDFQSLGDIGWYGSAYMLSVAAMQLIFGRVYRLYDTKVTFLASVFFFEVGSIICAAAPSSAAFIVGRAVAGAASAGIFSGFIMIMIPMVPLHRRPMFQSMFGLVFGITGVAGPLIGGAFTSNVSWRWCFWINLPIGAVSWFLMLLLWNPPKHKQSEDKKKKKKKLSIKTQVLNLDPLGILCLVPSVVCLLLALQWGGSTYAWNDGRIIALLVLFGVMAIAFCLVETCMPETATVPPKVALQRSVAFAALFTFFLAGGMTVVGYYLPVWFQTVKLASPVQSGIDTIPLLLSMVVAGFISGGFTQKIGYYVPSMFFCGVIMSIGNGLMGTFRPDTGSSHWIAFQFLSGFGLGCGIQTGGLAMQTVLPQELVSTGVALNMFAQQLGGAVFTSVGQNILSNLLVQGLEGVPGLDAAQIVQQGATNLLHIVPQQDVPLVIEAYNHGLTRVFLAAAGLTLAALLCAGGMEWRSIKKGRQGHGAKAEATRQAEEGQVTNDNTDKEESDEAAASSRPLQKQ